MPRVFLVKGDYMKNIFVCLLIVSLCVGCTVKNVDIEEPPLLEQGIEEKVNEPIRR